MVDDPSVIYITKPSSPRSTPLVAAVSVVERKIHSIKIIER